MTLNVYLSGEIHTDWREQIIEGAKGLDGRFKSPVTDHAASDDCGVNILGAENQKFWHDHKGAKVNAIRTRKGIADADIVSCDLVSNISNGTQHLTRATPRHLANRLSWFTATHISMR